MVEAWKTKLNMGQKVGEIYMDLTEDSLNHEFFIAKSKYNGLEQHAVEFYFQIATNTVKQTIFLETGEKL